MEIRDNYLIVTEGEEDVLLTPKQWEDIGLSEGLYKLADAGIISIRTRNNMVLLDIRKYVGKFIWRDRGFIIQPEYPILNDAIHNLIIKSPVKLVDGTIVLNEGEHEVLASRFLVFIEALEDAVSEGIPFDYFRRKEQTSTPTGSPDINLTFQRCISRGIRHEGIFDRQIRTYDVHLMNVVLTVLSILEDDTVPPEVRFRAEIIFSVICKAGIILRQDEALEAARILRDTYDSHRASLKRLIEYSIRILSDSQRIWDYNGAISEGYYRFSNMVRLWEIAVWYIFKLAVLKKANCNVEYHPYSTRLCRLIEPNGPDIDPDVCVLSEQDCVIVADAKYYDPSSYRADDVYQIVSYCSKLRAKYGFLVYLSTTDSWMKLVGITDFGTKIFAIGVEPSNIIGSIETISSLVNEGDNLPNESSLNPS